MSQLQQFKTFYRAAYGRAYPRIFGMSREPSWIMFEVIVPLLNTTAFVYLYRTLHAPEAYIGFLVLGATLTAYWLNVVWAMGTQLYWDKHEGFLELYIMAPVSLMAILVGMSAGGMYQATLRASLITIIGSLLFGVHMDFSSWPMILAAFGTTMISLYGLGMLLSSAFLMWGREAWQIALMLHEPAFFLTGLNFPLKKLFVTLPGFITFISAMIPISLGLDALRQLLFPGQIEGVFTPATEVLLLVGLAVLYITTAYFTLKKMEWLAKVEAKLSLRWQ